MTSDELRASLPDLALSFAAQCERDPDGLPTNDAKAMLDLIADAADDDDSLSALAEHVE